MKKEPADTVFKPRRKPRYTEAQAVDPSETDPYKSLADRLQVGVYIIQNKRFRLVNLRMQEYTGYTETELLEVNPRGIINPEDRSTVGDYALNMLKGLRISPYQYRLITKQGQTRWMMETVTPIIFEGKRAVLGNCMDITEQKEAKESLQELDALKASILDAIPQAIVGLQNRQINFANAAVEKVFGWHPEELIGKSVTVFYRDDKEANEIGRSFYTTLEHQRTFSAEFHCRHKDGRDILCRMRSSRIGETLKDRRIVITYEDITEQRRAEKELADSREQLRNLSAHLQSVREIESTRIAREIHDELGQMLTAIQMDIAWLGTRLPPGDRSLSGKVQRMRDLVDASIDSVHRISAELRPILLDDLGLAAAMEWQIQEFQSRMGGVQCRAHLDCEDGEVEKDLATALFRIFQETLTNIARHAGATLVKVRLTRTGDELHLHVSDNGKGITQKELDDPKSFGIIGIRERVALWNGTVTITSKPGRGTTVKVRIPLQRGEC